MTEEELENNQIISEFIGEEKDPSLYKRVVLFIQSIKLVEHQLGILKNKKRIKL